MDKVTSKSISVNDRILEFDIEIRQIIRFEKLFVVLLREAEETPNNILAYNYNGDEVWRINDIIQAEIPRGFDEMAKISNSVLEVYCELGIIYTLDIDRNKIITKEFIR